MPRTVLGYIFSTTQPRPPRVTFWLTQFVVAAGCWICAHLDPVWAGTSFQSVELLPAAGFACTYVGLVGALVIEGLEAGALNSVATAAAYSGFIHFIRIFGGQAGVSFMTHFISIREKLHSNLLGLHVQSGNWLTDERLRLLTAGMLPGSVGRYQAGVRRPPRLSRRMPRAL
jgi:DHA2 family multidrug resistance protein